MCVSSHVCLKFRVSQPAFSFLPESRNWVPLPATAHSQSGDAAGPGTRTSGLRPAPLSSSLRCLPVDRALAGSRGGAAGFYSGRVCLVAVSVSAAAISPVSVVTPHGLTPPGKTEQPLPKLAALLINTRKHNLRVLRAGPKSTVSWESGHVGGTRDAPPGCWACRVWKAPFGDLLQPSRGTEDGLELRLPA